MAEIEGRSADTRCGDWPVKPRPEVVALAKRVERVVGYVPAGFSDLLNILSHPDVRDLTQAWWEQSGREGDRG
jgi:hypothetical protein